MELLQVLLLFLFPLHSIFVTHNSRANYYAAISDTGMAYGASWNFDSLLPDLFMVYLTDRTSDFKMPHLGITVPALHGSTYAYIAIAIVIVALIIGVIFIQMIMRRQLVQTRKNWGLVFLYLLVSLFVPFLNKTNNFDYWILSAIPVSVIVSASFLYPERKWFSILIHWSLVALVLIMAYL